MAFYSSQYDLFLNTTESVSYTHLDVYKRQNKETTFSSVPNIAEEKVAKTPEVSTINSESSDLMNSLVQVDITNISGITFLPKV